MTSEIIIAKNEEISKANINELMKQLSTCIIIKGVIKESGETDIAYIVDYNVNSRYIKNQAIKTIKAWESSEDTEFIPWEFMKIINGSMISGSVNMVADTDMYKVFNIVG